MIIVPTEKRFDWRHSPLVLCAIVLLNILVYFLYQSNDTKKMMEAGAAYAESGYFEREWPLFQKYLEQHHETDHLREYRELAEDEGEESVMMVVLMRDDFFRDLQTSIRSNMTREEFDQWEINRTAINKKIQSTSSLAHGLRANNFHIPDLITYQFLHGGLMHLLGNMFFLIVCGFAVEAAIGHLRFLAFYLIAGAVGGYAHMAMNWQSAIPLVGASASISGVMAMYLAVFRLKKIEFFYWFFFFVGYLRAPALLILPFYIGKEIYSYHSDTDSNVAFMAHAGGFVAGAFLIGLAWLFNRSMFNVTYIESDTSVDPRQQQLAEIYESIEKYRFERALKQIDESVAKDGARFDLSLLRFNLLKISRGKNFIAAAEKLLATSNPSPMEIKQLETVWNDSPEARESLNDVQALKLGMQFSGLENPAAAEQIFELLRGRQCNDPAMSFFAARLAQAYFNLRNQEKKLHYEKLAKDMAKPQVTGV